MPEGDTIHRLATRLAPILTGRALLSFEARAMPASVAASLVGTRVLAVVARGKNLLVELDDGRALHVHLGMYGRFGVPRPRSRLYRPRPPPEVRLAVEGATIEGERLAILRLLRARDKEGAPGLGDLGPDLLGEALDVADAVRRLRALPGDPSIAEALLAQRAVAGIGNVYKSEVLFLERVSPRARTSTLDDPTLTRLLTRARALLLANAKARGPRVTRPSLGGPRLWVYGRAGRACLVCAKPHGPRSPEPATVERFLQGAPPGRSTYHCPRCQP